MWIFFEVKTRNAIESNVVFMQLSAFSPQMIAIFLIEGKQRGRELNSRPPTNGRNYTTNARRIYTICIIFEIIVSPPFQY
jgi:hypothetical protein